MDCERGIPRNGQRPNGALLPNLCRITFTVENWLAEVGRFRHVSGKLRRVHDKRSDSCNADLAKQATPRMCAYRFQSWLEPTPMSRDS